MDIQETQNNQNDYVKEENMETEGHKFPNFQNYCKAIVVKWCDTGI